MKNLFALLIASALIVSSFAEEDKVLESDTGCKGRSEEDSEEDSEGETSVTKDTCIKRNATANGYDCCFVSYKNSNKTKESYCSAVIKSKVSEIIDEAKKVSEDATDDGDKASDFSIECESNLMKYCSVLVLITLLSL